MAVISFASERAQRIGNISLSQAEEGPVPHPDHLSRLRERAFDEHGRLNPFIASGIWDRVDTLMDTQSGRYSP